MEVEEGETGLGPEELDSGGSEHLLLNPTVNTAHLLSAFQSLLSTLRYDCCPLLTPAWPARPLVWGGHLRLLCGGVGVQMSISVALILPLLWEKAAMGGPGQG